MPDTIEVTPGKDKRVVKGQKRLNSVRDSKTEKGFRDQVKKDIKLFTGEDQGWGDDDSRQKATEEGRPTVTMNRVAPIIRLMCGARPKSKATYSPSEEDDLEKTAIFNSLRDHVDSVNRWEFEESEWFKLGIVKSREVVEIEPNYDRDIRGDIELSLSDGLQWWLDPDSEKRDRSDDKYRFKIKTMSVGDAKRLWPHKKNAIESLVSHVLSGTEDAEITTDEQKPDDYHQELRSNYYDAASNKLTVVYYWYKEYKKITKIVDMMSIGGDGDPVIWESEKSVEQIKKELEELSSAPERFKVISVDDISVKYIVFIHDTILEEGDNPWNRTDGQRTLLSDNFPQIIFEPERIHNGTRQELTSILDPMYDPQKYYNRLASAILQIIGSTAQSGWEFEDGAASKKWIAKLKKFGSKPGFIMQWAKGALSKGLARRIQPTVPPQSHMAEAKQMAADLLDISGVESLVNTESLGKGASGVAIDLKQRQGGNIVAWVYESFGFFKHILAEYLRDAIQVMYDYEKVIKITGNKTRPIRINEEVYDYSGAVVKVLNDVPSGCYDVKIVEKDVMPTMRMERFRLFASMVEKGALQLPPPVMAQVVMTLMDDPELKQVVEEEMAEFNQMIAGQQGGGIPGGLPAPAGAF